MSSKNKITEADSGYDHLELMSMYDLLRNINKEDATVPLAVALSLPQIEKLLNALLPIMQNNGRLFYIGAGTSGRLGILDASECPPTFGVPQDMVIGLIAGGDKAIRKATEFAEDDVEKGWKDLQEFNITDNDFVIGIAASGSTPYVAGAIDRCNKNNITTGCITCNPGSLLATLSKFPIEIITGPEFITGSTRMKAGTAQKLVLNMISSSLMIKLGKVKGNKMVDMLLSNNKLIDRGTKMIMDALQIDEKKALELLRLHGSVRLAIKNQL